MDKLIEDPEINFSTGDIIRSNRAKIAVRLNKLPCELDTQPAQDIWDILGVFDDEAQRSKR